MRLPDSRLAIVLLVAALTAAAPPAFPEPPRSRAEALAALKNADTATRAEAVVWIANHGAMADAPLLHERLRDESGFVRQFAEQGLWLLWTRSGDRAIDQLMARATEEMQSGRYAEAIRTLSAVSIEIDSPSFNQSLLGACSVAFLEQTALLSGLTVPSFNAWNVT